jgi:hypothetical protein
MSAGRIACSRNRYAERGLTVFQRHELLSLDDRNGYAPTESDPGNLHIDPKRVSDSASEHDQLP